MRTHEVGLDPESLDDYIVHEECRNRSNVSLYVKLGDRQAIRHR